MKTSAIFVKSVLSAGIAVFTTAASANLYQFQFLANPDALKSSQDKSLDVLHTITIDSDKISSFSPSTLNATSTWLDGGISMNMTHQGKTVSLNSGLDPDSPYVTIPGYYYDEGFLSLSSKGIWFFALEFAPNSPFIDGNDLPYDPFVYGFLFAYQDDQAYQDFGSLWVAGDTSVLPSYQIPAVPEPSTAILSVMGALGALVAAKRKRG